MANTYTLIQSVTVGSGGAASIAFSSIPQTYTDLQLVFSTRSSTTSTQTLMKLNGLTTNFTARYLFGTGSSVVSGTESTGYVGANEPSTRTSNIFLNTQVYIPNYTGSTNKSYSVDSVDEHNASDNFMFLVAGLWSNTAAITSIEIYGNTGNLVQYSSASLYGIKNS